MIEQWTKLLHYKIYYYKGKILWNFVRNGMESYERIKDETMFLISKEMLGYWEE